MGNRNVVVLAVIFVLVLAWNALYFTGVVGEFGGSTAVPPAGDDSFDVPNFRGNVGGAQPVPSGAPRPTARGATAPAAGPRSTITSADLAIDSGWGRNPFLTPREIWAIDNYQTAPIAAAANPIPAGGLQLTAVLGDSGGRRMAVINGEVVGIGDLVAGMVIIDVWDDAVVFRLGTDRHVLRMNDAAVRLTVRGDGAGGQ